MLRPTWRTTLNRIKEIITGRPISLFKPAIRNKGFETMTYPIKFPVEKLYVNQGLYEYRIVIENGHDNSNPIYIHVRADIVNDGAVSFPIRNASLIENKDKHGHWGYFVIHSDDTYIKAVRLAFTDINHGVFMDSQYQNSRTQQRMLICEYTKPNDPTKQPSIVQQSVIFLNVKI